MRKEIPGTGVHMDATKVPHTRAPAHMPFVFPKKETEELAVGVDLALNVLLTGPTGCGKTTLVTQVAHHLGKPMVRFNCDGETRVSNLRGMMRPTSSEGVLALQFSRGALVEAMQQGYWVLFDEIDAALPSILFVLQPVLEEQTRAIYVPETGEWVHAHPDFRVFATGNTVGYRALARSRHAGTNALNDAFVDRFSMVIAVDYPSREEEIERVAVNVPALDRRFVDGICRVAEELRKLKDFRSDFSTRRCVQWARLTERFGPTSDDGVLRAAELAAVRKMSNPVDVKVAREVIRRVFGYEPGEFESHHVQTAV